MNWMREEARSAQKIDYSIDFFFWQIHLEWRSMTKNWLLVLYQQKHRTNNSQSVVYIRNDGISIKHCFFIFMFKMRFGTCTFSKNWVLQCFVLVIMWFYLAFWALYATVFIGPVIEFTSRVSINVYISHSI